ncbi:MAG: hypothetical protein IJH00_03140 [Erysipelotrichaceae bacterium]|nr:hypothetical protein [Erysipelotrichaceae bacterium]
MLTITEYDYNHNFRKLNNDPNVFHNALYHVLRGEKRFHVEGEGYDYDLVFEENDVRAKNDPSFPNSDFFLSEMLYPPYYFYDENDLSKINMDLLNGFDEIFFEEANEYSAVIAALALKHTALKVTFRNANIRLFPWLADKVECHAQPRTENALYVQHEYYPDFSDPSRYSTIDLFHCLFIMQWLTELPLDKVKYLSMMIRKTEGIGSIMSTFSQTSQALEKFGIKPFIEPNSTRFSNELLTKYFNIGEVPEDSTEENTIYVKSFNSFLLNHFVDMYQADVNLRMLKPEFIDQMKEYADSVIGDRKVLGVLLRGTDVVIANYKGSYRPAPIEDCIRIIGDRVKEHGYEKIFVATEDSYYLERITAAFPGKILAVAQERHRISEFQGIKYISDLEKKNYSGNAYYASVEDTTVNYLYAVYMLSRCESFISNCMCSGAKLVTSFNEGNFVRNEIVSEMLMENDQ